MWLYVLDAVIELTLLTLGEAARTPPPPDRTQPLLFRELSWTGNTKTTVVLLLGVILVAIWLLAPLL